MPDVTPAATVEPILKELYAELSSQGEMQELGEGSLLWKEGDPGDSRRAPPRRARSRS